MAGKNTTLEQSKIDNQNHIRRLHPKHRKTFNDFLRQCELAGYPLLIFSSIRSFQKQAELYSAWKSGRSKIQAAKPGRSLHEFGLAIDVYVYDFAKKRFEKNIGKYKAISDIASTLGLRWLGSTMKNEYHHFDYNNYKIDDLISLRKNNLLDESGYVDLSKINEVKTKPIEKITDFYNEEIGQPMTSEQIENIEVKEKEEKVKITKIEEFKASGIWQIVKLVADQYSLSQNINDATIAFNQGSILNFIQNIVQEPWLEFWGDTIGDKYYLNVRKQPFDQVGFNKLPVQDVITHTTVFSDKLDWYDGPVFSWYQIIPRGSFLGEQNLIFAYVTAVFFQEYAEIWGSKPNMQVSNYINFVKNQGKNVLFEKALEDLRYMVESNAYLPFTRQGTIVIKGRSSIRRGYRIIYEPTNEIFYVDSVSNRYNITDSGPEYTTILKVSRGMKLKYISTPENENTISYFNLILFEKQKPKKVKEKVKVKGSKGGFAIYFDNDRPYKIDLSENFGNSRKPADIKMVKQISKYPNLRKDLDKINSVMVGYAADFIENNKKANKFRTVGFIDPDNKSGSRWLSEQRAKHYKELIISEYLKKYKTFSRAELNQKIETRPNYNADTYKPIKITDPEDGEVKYDTNIEEASLKMKAYQRYADFYMDEYEIEVEKEVPSEEIAWRVNKPVFKFFLNRLQNGD